MSNHPLLAEVDLAGLGLEIGALHHPVVDRAVADVRYVDHATTEELRAKYADDPDVGEMVDVDVVWGDQDLRGALDAAIGRGRQVDYVVASHVIEHVPDLVGWLSELAGVIRPGGVVALAIPDKRFCFDARRRTTDVAEVIDAHLTNRRRPSLAATFDFWTKYDHVDAAAMWAGAPPPPPTPLRDREALDRTRAAATGAEYRDIHCWVFTPGSFADVLRRLAALELLPPFALRSLRETQPGSIEFHVVLTRLDDGLDPDERRARQLDDLRAAGAGGYDDGDPSAVAIDRFPISERERRAILAKRRLLGPARRRMRPR